VPALGRRGPGGRTPPPTGAAREHLANERTLLAWVRTAVTLIALGFAAARFGVFVDEQSPAPRRLGAATLIGVALVFLGTVSVALSLVRFLRAREQIGAGRFRAELWPEAVLTVLSAALGIGVVTYLLLRG
jgi:inner membrane protein YidH